MDSRLWEDYNPVKDLKILNHCLDMTHKVVEASSRQEVVAQVTCDIKVLQDSQKKAKDFCEHPACKGQPEVSHSKRQKSLL